MSSRGGSRRHSMAVPNGRRWPRVTRTGFEGDPAAARTNVAEDGVPDFVTQLIDILVRQRE